MKLHRTSKRQQPERQFWEWANAAMRRNCDSRSLATLNASRMGLAVTVRVYGESALPQAIDWLKQLMMLRSNSSKGGCQKQRVRPRSVAAMNGVTVSLRSISYNTIHVLINSRFHELHSRSSFTAIKVWIMFESSRLGSSAVAVRAWHSSRRPSPYLIQFASTHPPSFIYWCKWNLISISQHLPCTNSFHLDSKENINQFGHIGNYTCQHGAWNN